MTTKTIQLTQGYETVIDAADYTRQLFCQFSDGEIWIGRICDRPWHASVKPHTVYAVSTCLGERELRLHRLIAGARAGQHVDHRDGNGLNNLRSNLRTADPTGNACNRKIQKGGSTPFKGVAVHKQTGQFEAYIRHRRKKHHLGLHKSAVAAALAYDDKARELFGEFSRLNFPERYAQGGASF